MRIAALGEALLERLMVTTSDAVITTNESRAQTLIQRYGPIDVTVLANVPLLAERIDALRITGRKWKTDDSLHGSDHGQSPGLL